MVGHRLRRPIPVRLAWHLVAPVRITFIPQRWSACRGDVRGLRVNTTQPQWAVTPGQLAVLYDGEVCLGGGVIAA